MKDERAGKEKRPRTVPGMRSDLEPQPKEDPDFGPGMEYESGDRNPDFTEADQIRKHWKKSGKSRSQARADRDKKGKTA